MAIKRYAKTQQSAHAIYPKIPNAEWSAFLLLKEKVIALLPSLLRAGPPVNSAWGEGSGHRRTLWLPEPLYRQICDLAAAQRVSASSLIRCYLHHALRTWLDVEPNDRPSLRQEPLSDERAKGFALRREAIFLRRDTFAARQEIAVSSLMRAEQGALSERGYTKAFAALVHEETRFALLSPAQRRFAQAVYETGLSQAKAARRCGVSQAKISKWLRGEEDIQGETLSLALGRLCGEAPPAEQGGEDDGEGKKTTPKGQIQQIKERRIALGWTCEDLARDALVPAEIIKRAEKGKKSLSAEKYGLLVAALNAEERSRAQFVIHEGKVLKVGGFEDIRAGDQLCGRGGVRATVLQVIDAHSIRVLVDRGTGAHTAIWASKPVDGWAGQVVTR